MLPLSSRALRKPNPKGFGGRHFTSFFLFIESFIYLLILWLIVGVAWRSCVDFAEAQRNRVCGFGQPPLLIFFEFE